MPILLVVLATLLVAAPASAQFENLQVLPEDISRSELSGVMRSFTSALGVRCSSCHVGEEGAPLSTYDMASDDLVMKRKAREMMRMMQEINERVLPALPDRAEGAPTVSCATCHGGVRIPRPIEEVVRRTVAAEGADAAVIRYMELRERHFGGRQYDFSEGALLAIGGAELDAGALDASAAFFRTAIELFGESAGALVGLGAVAEEAGRLDEARGHYRRVLELDPENRQAARRLQELGGGL